MSVVTLDLNKNPDVAALVADKDVGSTVCARFTIKAKDDQTLTLRVDEMAGSKDELSDGEGADDVDTDEVDSAEEKPSPTETAEPAEESMAKRMSKKLSGGSSMME